MKSKFLKYLVDPISNNTFNRVLIFERCDQEIISGIISNDISWYPIIRGIPRILVDEMRSEILRKNEDFLKKNIKKMPKRIVLEWMRVSEAKMVESDFFKHQKVTSESFAYEWNEIYNEDIYEKNNFLHFVGPFITEKTIKNKLIVDIGCGSGRFTKWPAEMGAKVVFGTDLGDSVEFAYNLTKKLDNVCIVQADIYNMPFIKNMDIAYSIGVLHHLPKPKEGFLCLKKVLKNKGLMNIWVYNRRHNIRALYFYEPLRKVTRKIPKSILYILCYIPAFIVHIINQFSIFFKRIGMGEFSKKIPFSYYSNFNFNMKLNDTFDVLATPKSNYYFVEEIHDWFAVGGYTNIRSFEHPEAGITCVGNV